MSEHNRSRYDRHGCRCDECRADKTRKQRGYRARRIARTGGKFVRGRFSTEPRVVQRRKGDAPPHGTKARYEWRQNPCRCSRCRDAVNAYHRQLRARKKAAA